jgi:hypothetical protein
VTNSLSYGAAIQRLYFSSVVGPEDIFKPATGNGSLYAITGGNAVSQVNFLISKTRTVTTTFTCLDIHVCNDRWHTIKSKLKGEMFGETEITSPSYKPVFDGRK